jgi:hypothetical protein
MIAAFEISKIDMNIFCLKSMQYMKNPRLTKPNRNPSAANGEASLTIALLVIKAEDHRRIKSIGKNLTIM